MSLYEVRIVPTQAAHSQRVYRGLAARSNKAAKAVYRGFLTCMEDKELRLYAFVRKVFREGDRFMRNLSDPVFYPLHKALRHMSGELEKLRGFVRFSDYNGVLGAVIEPENQVLPMLRRHFCGREILLYARGISKIQPLERLDLAAPDAEEVQYRRLWKAFFETVTIRERENPRCQNTFLPKRYRGVMTEFLPLDSGGVSAEPSWPQLRP